MALTNLGDAVENKITCSTKESWKIGIAQREGKGKFLKALKCGSALLAQRLVTKYVDITSFCSRYGKAARSFITYSLAGRRPYFFPFLTRFLFLLAWLKLIWILFLLSSDEIILRQNCLSSKYCWEQKQPTRSRFLTK